MNAPASTFHRMTQSTQPGVGKAVVGKPKAEEEKEKKIGVTLYVSLFFDGTKNNRYNTSLRMSANNLLARQRRDAQFEPSEKEADQLDTYESFKKTDSYFNYYSNVALLSYMNKKRKYSKKELSVYVEGAGTDYEEKLDGNKKPVAVYSGDTTAGSGFGTGDTGIPDKVAKGIQKVRNEVVRQKLYNVDKQYIEEIKVDVFGFSRGAAEARHFVSRRLELSRWPDQEPARVTVQFVGLFDTVSSYGRSFLDDVEQLKLAIGGQARKVVHLVAGDECRENFISTTIHSSIAAGVGYELVLPGVHSDVGGGYGEVEHEERLFDATGQRDLARLVREGWFRPDPDPRKSQVRVAEEGYYKLVTTYTRRTVYYQYQLITLAIMANLAHNHGLSELGEFDPGAGSFTGENSQAYNVPALLVPLRQQMRSFAVANDRPQRAAFALPLTAEGKLVRNRYLHRSEKIQDDVNNPHFGRDFWFQRESIDG